MAKKGPTTSWMWPTDDGDVNGATIDSIDRVIHWFDSGIGCACGDSTIEQSYAEYRQKGAPLALVPEAVQAEIRMSLDTLESA
jgi:hypothetical protein